MRDKRHILVISFLLVCCIGAFYNWKSEILAIKDIPLNPLQTRSDLRGQLKEVGYQVVNLIPSDAKLQNMTVGELADLYHGYMHSTQVLCNRVTRMGKIDNGGWDICDDPKYRPNNMNCLVYSFGINNKWSFDDAMEQYGCEVHSFDPSMTSVKDHIRGQRIHFHQVGIGGENVDKRPDDWALFTLGTLRKQNGHEPGKRRVDILKMDVEGHEAASLLAALDEGSLRDVGQLSYEIHMKNVHNDPDKNAIVMHLKILRRLWDIGFRLFRTDRNLPSKYRSAIHKKESARLLESYFVNVNPQWDEKTIV